MAYSLPSGSSYYILDGHDIGSDWFNNPLCNSNEIIIEGFHRGYKFIRCTSFDGNILYVLPSHIVPDRVIERKALKPDIITRTHEVTVKDSEWGWKASWGKQVIYMEK